LIALCRELALTKPSGKRLPTLLKTKQKRKQTNKQANKQKPKTNQQKRKRLVR
jgi:hypothetical protein